MNRNVYRMCRLWMVAGMAFCAISPAFGAGVFYVVPNGAGTTGTSWADAFGAIQPAIDAAVAAGGGEVWVKAGTYTNTTPDPLVHMRSGVDIYGGFDGTEVVRESRDWSKNVTIIDGDYGELINSSCVMGADNATIDGFTLANGLYPITGGGGGIHNDSASPTINHCIFYKCEAFFNGGAIYNQASSPSINYCTFIENTADTGGAIYNKASSPSINYCTFSKNTAVNGGAVYNEASSPSINFCTFSKNGTTTGDGGGLYSTGAGTIRLDGCKLDANTSAGNGGGLYVAATNIDLTNCLFTSNTGAGNGGGLYVDSLVGSVTNCDFVGNTATAAGGGLYAAGSAVISVANIILWGNNSTVAGAYAATIYLYNSCVQGGYSGPGGNNTSADPRFVDGSLSDGDGYDLHLQSDSSCIDTGMDARNPGRDIQLLSRPTGAHVDIGAHEYRENTAGVRYVVPGGTGDGKTTWAAAMGSIQAAIDDLALWISLGYLDTGEVWVKQGTYSSSALNPVVTMKENIHLYGGFSGTEMLRDARNAAANVTIISGDSNGDGTGDRLCVKGANGSTLDGFTITKGYASGGGMYVDNVSPTIANCTFTQNTNASYGALTIMGGSPTITHCLFSQNSGLTMSGGGIYAKEASPTVSDCVFSENTVASGGGIYLESANLTASGCTFTKNNTSSGGGITCDNVAATTITNCAFAENIAANNGGGMYVDPDSAPTIMQCRFTGNTAVKGGGIYHGGGITSACIFLQNTADTGGGVYIGDAAMLQNCLFDRNNDTNMTGGALFNAATNYSTLFNSTLCGNSGGIANGNNAKIILTNNILWGNTSEITNASGAAAYASNSCIEGGYSGSYVITSDPCFINATAANGGPNYRLRRSSPCIDHGSSTAAPPVDLDGVSRPQHGGFDMGCYEYVNTAPVITQSNPLAVNMSEDGVPTAWTAPALSATDPDGQTLTWSLETQAAHGVAVVSGNGASPTTFTYAPAPNYNGADSFVARVSDGVSASTITINVLVASVNDLPVIAQSGPIAVSMSEDGSPTAWTAPTLTATDIEGDTLTWSVKTSPAHGAAVVSGTGASPSQCVYTPAANYYGADSFVVQVGDGKGGVAQITLAVTLTAVNDYPVIAQSNPIYVTMNINGSPRPWVTPTITASDADGELLTWSCFSTPFHGTATVSGTGASPTIAYAPNTGFSGMDSFTALVEDPNGAEVVISISVWVKAYSPPPLITQSGPLTVSMSEDGVQIPWMPPALSATHPSGYNMTWSLYSQAAHGTAVISGSDSEPEIFTYTPAPNYNGPDSFVVVVTDVLQESATITVNVTVTPENDPVTIDQTGPLTASMSEDGSPTAWVAPTVSASDIDAGDTLTWMMYDFPANGTADVSGVGLSPSIFTYTPNPNYNGPDSFRVAVMDSGGEMAFITVNVLVTAVDDAPVIDQTGPVSVSMNEDGAGGPWGAPLISATDGDGAGDELTWFVEMPASHGVATVSGTGASPTTFDYVPQAGYSGGDTFTIAVRDSGGETASIQIEVSISPVNDAPVLNQSGTIDVTMSEDGAPTPFSAPSLSAVDEEGGVLTWYIGGPAAHGDVQIAGVGASPTTFTYTPAPDYTGEDSFIAAVLDDESASAWVTIHVTIEPVNDAPVITQTGPIAVAMSEDGAPTAWTAPALDATDIDGDSLTWSVETPASHGVATVSGTGASPTVFSYAPQADYSGPDSFVIAVDDGQGETASITIEVAIAPVPLTIDLAGEEKVQVKAGDSHTFTATASGGQGTVHYQWFFQPEKGEKAYTAIEGATDGAYTLASIRIDQAGAYYCQAYDDNTVVDSAEVQLVVLPGVPAAGPGVILLAALTITLVMSWRTHRKSRG